jgi:hypothetical protein
MQRNRFRPPCQLQQQFQRAPRGSEAPLVNHEYMIFLTINLRLESVSIHLTLQSSSDCRFRLTQITPRYPDGLVLHCSRTECINDYNIYIIAWTTSISNYTTTWLSIWQYYATKTILAFSLSLFKIPMTTKFIHMFNYFFIQPMRNKSRMWTIQPKCHTEVRNNMPSSSTK